MMKLSSMCVVAALLIATGCATTAMDDASTLASAATSTSEARATEARGSETTIEGTLYAVPGLPNGPGVAIFEPAGFTVRMVELLLEEAEKKAFVSGQNAKVTGTLTPLPGLGRDALDVRSMVVCPAAGTWVDCMPGLDEPSTLCRERTWVSENCRDVRFAD